MEKKKINGHFMIKNQFLEFKAQSEVEENNVALFLVERQRLF